MHEPRPVVACPVDRHDGRLGDGRDRFGDRGRERWLECGRCHEHDAVEHAQPRRARPSRARLPSRPVLPVVWWRRAGRHPHTRSGTGGPLLAGRRAARASRPGALPGRSFRGGQPPGVPARRRPPRPRVATPARPPTRVRAWWRRTDGRGRPRRRVDSSAAARPSGFAPAPARRPALRATRPPAAGGSRRSAPSSRNARRRFDLEPGRQPGDERWRMQANRHPTVAHVHRRSRATPAGKGAAGRCSSIGAPSEREATCLGGISGEHGGVADRQQLCQGEPESDQHRQRSEELDRRLSPFAPHHTGSSPARAATLTALRHRWSTIGTGTATRVTPAPSDRTSSPGPESARHDRPGRGLGVLAHQRRPCCRARRVRGHPRGVSDEYQLPDDQAKCEQRRHDPEQLDRRLSPFTRHMRTVAAPRLRLNTPQLQRGRRR